MLKTIVSRLGFMRRSSSSSIPSEQEITSRVMAVLRTFDKADKSKIDASRKFSELGLDSLDQVELVIALEEEFRLELTDDVAEKITSPEEAGRVIKQSLLLRQ